MNAYELAEHFKNDLLPHERHANHAETMYWVDQYRTFGKRAEAMFRKQADRIEELEKEVKQYEKFIAVEHLTKQKVSSKPVAWMHKNPDYAISKHQSLEFNIPLYTHPVKQLSDEEIEKVIESVAHYGVIAKNDYLVFARAIIKEITE